MIYTHEDKELTIVAFDTETELFSTNNMAPRVVCLSYATKKQSGEVVSGVIHHTKAESFFKRMLVNDNVLLVGHNVAYDMSCMMHSYPNLTKLVFDKYEKRLVTDTNLRNKLDTIRWGKRQSNNISLANLRKHQSGVELEKDLWRTGYMELFDTPIEEWPQGAIDYARIDAEETYKAYCIQLNQTNEYEQAIAAFCLELSKVEGLQTDQVLVERLKEYHTGRAEVFLKDCISLGVMRTKVEHTVNWHNDVVEQHKELLLSMGAVGYKKATYKKVPDKLALHEAELWELGYIKGRNNKGELKYMTKPQVVKVPGLESKLVDLGVIEIEPARFVLTKQRALEYRSTLEKLGCCSITSKTSHPKNMKDIRALIEQSYSLAGLTVPYTEGGNVSTDRETLEKAAKYSKDERLNAIASYTSENKIIGTYLDSMKAVIHPRYDSLKDTGRTSCAGTSKKDKESGNAAYYSVNVQNLPRSPGVRECFIAGEGNAFVFVDYSALELAALAHVNETLFGEGSSKMAELIRNNMDLHLYMASHILNISYDEAKDRRAKGDKLVKDTRQLSKIANFGFGADMSPTTFVEHAASQGVEITVGKAEELKSTWLNAFPEMNKYFRYFRKLTDNPSGEATFVMPGSGRIRGGMYYSVACNTPFQGTAADGAKAAMWQLTKARYLDELSPLYGLKCPIFVHDEFAFICPEGMVHEVAEEMSKLMIAGMQEHITTVPVSVEATASRRWYKAADVVTDEDGRLAIWEPGEKWNKTNKDLRKMMKGLDK